MLRARECLAFHLSGLSKVCGLPQVKAGWIAAAGPEDEVAAALERLEVIADVYLSVSGPAQLALPTLLARREAFLGPLRARLAENRAAVAAVAARRSTRCGPMAGGAPSSGSARPWTRRRSASTSSRTAWWCSPASSTTSSGADSW